MTFKGKKIGEEDRINAYLEDFLILFFTLRISVFIDKFVELLMSRKKELIFRVELSVDILKDFAAFVLFSLNVVFEFFDDILDSFIG
jgi:hypothetical protein